MSIQINTERLVDTFTKLVSIDSPSYGERQMADEVTRRLNALGIQVEEDDAAARIGGNAGNLYAYVPGDETQAPILLSGHLDTVAPALGKRAIRESDGRIHSAGDTVLGADDLAAVSIILEVLTVLKESGVSHRPVEVLISAAEEPYCVGGSAFDFSRLKSKEAYVLDNVGPLGEAIIGAPSILDFTAEVIGKASHAGFAPEEGISAITTAAKAISQVKSGRVSPNTTLNFGLVSGGLATNIVPASCTVKGEIRSDDHALALEQMDLVRKAFQDACAETGAELNFVDKVFLKAYTVSADAPVVRRYFDACARRGYELRATRTFGGSDNNLLTAHGIDGIVISGAMHACHSCQEYTTVQELEEVAAVVADMILTQD